MKILIAEDDTLMMKIMELCLAQEGYDIICCQDGLDAMKRIEQENPDVIILDIMLPYFSGLEILGKVKQKGTQVPVIMVSAMGQQTVMDEAIKLGADHFISKPFNINYLKAYLQQFSTVAATA